MSTFDVIDTHELQRRREADQPLHLWNVLTDDYFTGEMIPGSERVPLDRLLRHVRERNPAEDAEIVVYCAGPDCPQSAMAAEKLVESGFQNVHDYEGGLEAWKDAGLPVEKETESVEEAPAGTRSG